VKVAITLAGGETRHLLGVEDADNWMKSFGVRGTSLLGDWIEVVPDDEDGHTRTFVRASQVVSVHLIADQDDAGQPSPGDPLSEPGEAHG
jgi:hypothetical protein